MRAARSAPRALAHAGRANTALALIAQMRAPVPATQAPDAFHAAQGRMPCARRTACAPARRRSWTTSADMPLPAHGRDSRERMPCAARKATTALQTEGQRAIGRPCHQDGGGHEAGYCECWRPPRFACGASRPAASTRRPRRRHPHPLRQPLVGRSRCQAWRRRLRRRHPQPLRRRRRRTRSTAKPAERRSAVARYTHAQGPYASVSSPRNIGSERVYTWPLPIYTPRFQP